MVLLDLLDASGEISALIFFLRTGGISHSVTLSKKNKNESENRNEKENGMDSRGGEACQGICVAYGLQASPPAPLQRRGENLFVNS